MLLLRECACAAALHCLERGELMRCINKRQIVRLHARESQLFLQSGLNTFLLANLASLKEVHEMERPQSRQEALVVKEVFLIAWVIHTYPASTG